MIIERLPTSLKDFLAEVESLGFVLTLVGGVPRDFLFLDIIGNDFDFEIRADRKIEMNAWPLYYQKLQDFLQSKNLPFKILPYLITRVEFGEYKLEFSSPRTEINREGDFSHHHFEAMLDSNLPYDISFRRRDFTINAVGIKFDFKNDTDELVDPYGGVFDIKNGVLKNITDDFFHDSVRFLRLIRFQLKFDRFMIDAEVLNKLSRFNLTKLSIHHFTEELFKSTPGKFLNLFGKLVKDYHLQVPPDFSVWLKFSFNPELNSKEELLGFVFLQNEAEAKQVEKFFSLPVKILKDLRSFYASYEYISRIRIDELKSICGTKVEIALNDPLFKELKNLDEKKVWCAHLHLKESELPVDWNDWTGINVDSKEIEVLPAALRSYLIYYKALQKKFSDG